MSGPASRSQSNVKGGDNKAVGHKPATVKEAKRTRTDTGNTSGGNAASHSSAHPKDTQKKDNVGQGTTSEVPPCPVHQMPIKPTDINYIGYGIYVGNFYAPCIRFLETNKFTHVLSLGCEPLEELPEKKFKTKYIEVEDGPGANIEEVFNASFSFIDEGTKGANKILVHCWAGSSRSITVVIGYLHHRKKFSWEQAHLWVANRRPRVWPHSVFLEYMAEKASNEKGARKTFTVADFTLPGHNERKFADKGDVNRKYLDSLNLEELFSGCEEDKKKNERLIFPTKEAEET